VQGIASQKKGSNDYVHNDHTSQLMVSLKLACKSATVMYLYTSGESVTLADVCAGIKSRLAN